MKNISWIRRLAIMATVGGVLAFPGTQMGGGAAHAAPAKMLQPAISTVGTWYNFDHQTKDVTHFTVSLSSAGQSIRTYGACHPSDCDWGSAPLSAPGAQQGATYHFSFAVITETLFVSGPFLRLVTQTHFTDNSGRADSSDLELFYNPSTTTHWSNTDPAARGIGRLTLSFTASGQGIMDAYGVCHPTDCAWGTQRSAASTPPVPMYFYFDHGFAKKELVIAGDGSGLQVETFAQFTDNSGRKNYQLIEHLAYAG